jgi:hypothetical protein
LQALVCPLLSLLLLLLGHLLACHLYSLLLLLGPVIQHPVHLQHQQRQCLLLKMLQGYPLCLRPALLLLLLLRILMQLSLV